MTGGKLRSTTPRPEEPQFGGGVQRVARIHARLREHGLVRSNVWTAAAKSLLVVTCLYVFVANAWVVDDAYITFRTVDNIAHGFGPRWNVDERVQAYTHPLCMMVMSLARAVTSDVFYTCLGVSLLCCVGALALAQRGLRRAGVPDLRVWLLLLVLLSSKAFVDYTSSGLENALSYLLAAWFLYVYLLRDRCAKRRPLLLLLVASLAFVNRQDTLLLYAPALVHVLWVEARAQGARRVAALLAVGTLPATLWLGFALLYYGFPFPNPAYAKVFASSIPMAWRIGRGLDYLQNSIAWDTASHLVLVVALALAASSRARRSLLVLGGVLLYLVFVVIAGGSSTHMSGRFLAVPFFVSSVVLVRQLQWQKAAGVTALLLVVYLAWWPLSTLKMGTSLYRAKTSNPSRIDANLFVHAEGAALINWRPGKSMPAHAWYRRGEKLRERLTLVHVGGENGREAIGYFGFAAGPDKLIVDRLGLSDPLIARMRSSRAKAENGWKSGHLHRRIPEGYVESVSRNRNLIRDPELAAYYEKVRNVTRGPLFSPSRWRDIWHLNVVRPVFESEVHPSP